MPPKISLGRTLKIYRLFAISLFTGPEYVGRPKSIRKNSTICCVAIRSVYRRSKTTGLATRSGYQWKHASFLLLRWSNSSSAFSKTWAFRQRALRASPEERPNKRLHPVDKSTWKTGKSKDSDSLRSGARQGALRLLRFATALRVTPPHRYGSRRWYGRKEPFGPDTARNPNPPSPS